jgi:hypothetical protein
MTSAVLLKRCLPNHASPVVHPQWCIPGGASPVVLPQWCPTSALLEHVVSRLYSYRTNIDWYLYTVRQEKNSVSGGRKWALTLATLRPSKACDRNPKNLQSTIENILHIKMCFVSLNFVRLRVHANIDDRGKTMPTTRAVHKNAHEGIQRAKAVTIFHHRGRSRAPSPAPLVATSDAGTDSVNEQ